MGKKDVGEDRLHQHVGSEHAYGGYEKQTDGHGHYWMESTDNDGDE